MLRPWDLPRLRWHPHMRRVENHAVFVERRGGQPILHPDVDPDGDRERRLDERSLLHEFVAPVERRDHVLIYLMACGHRSLPNRAVCERGCLTAPAWGSAFRGTAEKPRGVS